MPIFLPFEGCPFRCIFCAQDKQTGLHTTSENIQLNTKFANILNVLKNIQKEKHNSVIVELAFYGGTFTLLPEKTLQMCLDMVSHCYSEGLISYARCSTRPDALDMDILMQLKKVGIGLVELGIQSFSDHALTAAQRGYRGEVATEACKKLYDAGLEFGIQLLPGMPGSTPEVFIDDVEHSIRLRPKYLRFYPCLVVEGTQLAQKWKKGLYKPWDTETTVAILGKALAQAWSATIPVIRLSLAPEQSLDEAVLDGPRHPSLGSMIQGEALLATIQSAVVQVQKEPIGLSIPSFCRGFFLGHSGSLKSRWESLGVEYSKIVWSSDQYGEVYF